MRQPSIDVLRMLAIVMMVVVHFVENLSAWHGAQGDGGLSLDGFWRPTGLAAPLFTFLAGVSYRLWVRGREDRHDSDEAITKAGIRRGLFLIGLGFAFNVLVWLPADVFNWDVLTFIGSALLLLTACRGAPPPVLVLMAVAAVGVSPALRQLADYPSFWTEGFYDPDLTLGDVALGFLCVGYFPVFPWIAYPLAGYAAAPGVFPRPGERGSLRPGLTGAVLVLTTTASVLARRLGMTAPAWFRVQGWTMFPPSLEYVCGTLGMALVLLSLAHQLLDDRGPDSRLARVAGTFSRHSLTIYLLHHAVHVWPLWIWAAWTGADDVTVIWQRALPASTAFGLAVLFLALAYPLCRWLDAPGRRGVEGWMRWICD